MAAKWTCRNFNNTKSFAQEYFGLIRGHLGLIGSVTAHDNTYGQYTYNGFGLYFRNSKWLDNCVFSSKC